MRALRWLGIALLIWGLFTGIAYLLTPLLTERWGNDLSSAAGAVLVIACAAGLLALGRRTESNEQMPSASAEGPASTDLPQIKAGQSF